MNIDVAFIRASTVDEYGNATGQIGPNACGSLGYSFIDATSANRVVVIADYLVDDHCNPASISQPYVDFVVKVKRIGGGGFAPDFFQNFHGMYVDKFGPVPYNVQNTSCPDPYGIRQDRRDAASYLARFVRRAAPQAERLFFDSNKKMRPMESKSPPGRIALRR